MSTQKSSAGGTMKWLACQDSGQKCSAVFQGKKDDELVGRALQHAFEEHDAPLSVEYAGHLRKLIKAA